MYFPFHGDGLLAPLGADGITARAAHAALVELDALGRETARGLDLTQELPETDLHKVLDLSTLWQPARKRPPSGVPGQAEHWDDKANKARRRLTQAVEKNLHEVSNTSGKPVTVLGADDCLDKRAEAFRACIAQDEPVVSVSASGCLRRWLSANDSSATSLSILTFIPGRPLYAAVVTPGTALLSDCSGSWRLTLADGWTAMTGEPLVADPDPSYIVLPSDLEPLGPALRRHYQELIFSRDTSSVIAQAVLGGAVPVAVHFTEHVLNSAIFPVAVGHGMVVRVDSGKLIEKPWDASRHLYKALTGEIPFGDEHVIARDLWAIKRATRILALERDLAAQAHPLDAPFDIPYEDELYGFSDFDDDDD
ncbi:hypothetical protein [Streptomyces galbus]|uniref:Uncharacterized protein n=1 Tax=Streptomyces galbus TaxID=33898 RepID=A0A4U5W6R1_STRGB|nr:hypothetical protein [Streptomyces galbus]TKS95815.1 hypothetical protein E4U92_35070 [Streptomyces galbus]GHD52475.1 hypothetical protein GCM10010335_65050 [Streptomyces galbus]